MFLLPLQSVLNEGDICPGMPLGQVAKVNKDGQEKELHSSLDGEFKMEIRVTSLGVLTCELSTRVVQEHEITYRYVQV